MNWKRESMGRKKRRGRGWKLKLGLVQESWSRCHQIEEVAVGFVYLTRAFATMEQNWYSRSMHGASLLVGGECKLCIHEQINKILSHSMKYDKENKGRKIIWSMAISKLLPTFRCTILNTTGKTHMNKKDRRMTKAWSPSLSPKPSILEKETMSL